MTFAAARAGIPERMAIEPGRCAVPLSHPIWGEPYVPYPDFTSRSAGV